MGTRQSFSGEYYNDDAELDLHSWSDKITDAWLRGEDITSTEWWYEVEVRYSVENE